MTAEVGGASELVWTGRRLAADESMMRSSAHFFPRVLLIFPEVSFEAAVMNWVQLRRTRQPQPPIESLQLMLRDEPQHRGTHFPAEGHLDSERHLTRTEPLGFAAAAPYLDLVNIFNILI